MFDRKQKFEQTVTRIVHYQSNLYLKFGSVSALISKTTGTPKFTSDRCCVTEIFLGLVSLFLKKLARIALKRPSI